MTTTPLPDAEVTGCGRIIDRKTGQVTHFRIGSPEAQEGEPTTELEGEKNADSVHHGA